MNEEGKIHIPVLKIRSDDPFDTSDIGEEWTPVQNIRTGMYSAISSLHSPNVHYAANERVGMNHARRAMGISVPPDRRDVADD